MSILMNKKLANKSLITSVGKIQFSNEGTAEVEDSMAKKLATLKGFSIVGEESEDEEAVVGEVEDSQEESIDEEVDDVQEEQADETVEEESEDEETSITEEELQNMNVKQLEKYAKENNIDLGSATKKADIISAILGN